VEGFIGWPRDLFVLEFEHECSFAKMVADNCGHSHPTSIEKTHRRVGKGRIMNKDECVGVGEAVIAGEPGSHI
jgi:hypothetical protein